MGPRFVSAGGPERGGAVGDTEHPSMGPRFVSAGGVTVRITGKIVFTLQLGRASSAREA